MGKLSDTEIRSIIQKATLLKKFREGSSSFSPGNENDELKKLFEITDELDLPRNGVYEAYLEHNGIPVTEPILVDTLDYNSAKVIGFANGRIDKELLHELKSHVEYHFNTMGNISQRRNKIIWEAKPSGISRLFASSNSPKVEFEQIDNNTKIRVSKSLKTINKLYLPAIAAAFGGFMMFAGSIYGEFGNDVAPPMIVSLLILTGTYLYTRFVKGRKDKQKKDLQELTETLQGKIERHFKATATHHKKETNSSDIEIPENDYEEVTFDEISKPKMKE
ncbi:MAG TPA: hypothetical protein VFM80_06270 [Gracilimonas sp.]|uniref:hypothetical protein n=1 Tax=Gracilimonas sp. TaxID=1974203 RepID=UPI002DAB2C4F|nr:hypothetical protein [Gracilimonas sp.]